MGGTGVEGRSGAGFFGKSRESTANFRSEMPTRPFRVPRPFIALSHLCLPLFSSLEKITKPIFIFALLQASPLILFPHPRILPFVLPFTARPIGLSGVAKQHLPEVLLPQGGALSDAAVEVLIHALPPLAPSALQLHPLHVLPPPSRFLPRTSHPHLCHLPSPRYASSSFHPRAHVHARGAAMARGNCSRVRGV